MQALSQLKPTRMPFLRVSFDRTLHEEVVPKAPQDDEVPGATRWQQRGSRGGGGGFQVLEGPGVWPGGLSEEIHATWTPQPFP